MSNFKYKYYRLPPCGKAFADIGCYIALKNAENIIVREKIDLDGGIFSNTGKGEYTFVEFAGRGVNETIDGVNLYGNGSLYIKRKDLRPTLPFGKPEDEFQKQIKEYVQSKKSCNEIKKIPLSLEEKLDIAVKAIKLARDTSYSSSQDCPKCTFIEKKLTEALAKIKEIK